MNKITGNIISGLLGLVLLLASAMQLKAEEKIYLFPDRSSAVSGDTIWFNVMIFNGDPSEMSDVVHVQLDAPGNTHVTKVSVHCQQGMGNGFISVPDSLSTGVYILRAFSSIQRSEENAVVNQRFISVYNRFDQNISTINTPLVSNSEKYKSEENIEIKSGKQKYSRGEEVSVSLDIPKNILDEASEVIITAGMEVPFADDFSTAWYPVTQKSKVTFPVALVEKNGVLISGKVHSAEDNQPVENAVVILSIPDSVPFFDYCVSDSTGSFYFYLRNAIGNADLVLQALAKNSLPCTIELSENYFEAESISSNEKMLNHKEIVFAEDAVKASYFNKFFTGFAVQTGNKFSMEREFEYPFYGEPSRTFDPDLFIDLPDFKEIAREILHGVMYRERKNGTTIRLIDNGGSKVFTEEPLKLLDGIPVFDPEVFAPMGTKDIDKVDAVFFKRFFGDLSFDGVLSIYTKSHSLSWVESNPSMGHFVYPCLQENKEWNFSNSRVENTHVPNFNKVLYRNVSSAESVPADLSFSTSDLQGNVVVRVTLVQKDQQILYSQKLITVE